MTSAFLNQHSSVLTFLGLLALFSCFCCVSAKQRFAEEEYQVFWKQWKTEHHKGYGTSHEHDLRYKVFKDNIDFVTKHNEEGGHNYTVAMNPFGDLTSEEFKARYCTFQPPSVNKAANSAAVEQLVSAVQDADTAPVDLQQQEQMQQDFTDAFVSSLTQEDQERLAATMQRLGIKYYRYPRTPRTPSQTPAQTASPATGTTVDWVARGAVTAVKYQGSCGCCYSFAAVAAAESLYKIKKGVLNTLSEQELVDCDTRNSACGGGWYGYSWDFMASYGIMQQSAYPFTSTNGVAGSCKRGSSYAIKLTGSPSYAQIPNQSNGYKNLDAIQSQVNVQPVVVAMDGSASGIQFYKSGIFTGPCSTATNHAVLVVGYGTQNGQMYWKIKNSWGTWWGISGYLLLARQTGSGIGTCGMGTWGAYPLSVL